LIRVENLYILIEIDLTNLHSSNLFSKRIKGEI
jgi:hypothetical protein